MSSGARAAHLLNKSVRSFATDSRAPELAAFVDSKGVATRYHRRAAVLMQATYCASYYASTKFYLNSYRNFQGIQTHGEPNADADHDDGEELGQTLVLRAKLRFSKHTCTKHDNTLLVL